MGTVAYLNAKSEGSPLDIAPVAGRIGAELRGIALSAALDDATVAAIRAALVRHKVIFFRDQFQLDDASHEAFGARMGKVVVHATLPAKTGTSATLLLDSLHGGIANSWHTDLTFLETVPDASILRGVVVPEVGGDTLFANTAAAYQDLPATLRDLADKLWAVHCNDYDYASALSVDEKEIEKIRDAIQRSTYVSKVYETEHPLVRVHPESGERTLLLGHFIKKFVGVTPDDSRRLFATFQDYIIRPENTVRWRWRAGDVAIWDNRATQHRAIADFGTQRRIMQRVTFGLSVPVGVDGRTSRVLKPATAPVANAN